jgi:hypothetical protein
MLGWRYPSAWNTDYRVIQLKGGGALSNDGGNTEIRFSQNAFVDSGSLNKYIATAAATRYRQTSGVHLWEYATSGTAGNNITFYEAMRITNAGLVGIGTSSPSARFHVSGGDSVYGSTNLCRILSSGQVIDFTNAAQDTYVAGRINGLNLKFYTNSGSGIDIDSSGRCGDWHYESRHNR